MSETKNDLKNAVANHGTCLRTVDELMDALTAERAAHERTRERVREALETLSDGACSSPEYGQGCDGHCKSVAYHALAALAAPEAGGGE